MKLVARETLLLVGEGDDEKAFTGHACSIYVTRGCGVSVKLRNAYGRGPENILRAAIRAEGSFDRRAVLLDTDVPWTAEVRATAARHKIHMIGSTPCLDGLILRALSERVPVGSKACKEALSRIWPRGISDARTLERSLTREVLEEARLRIPELNMLLRLLEGR